MVVDRDRLVIFDSHLVVFAHCLDSLDEVRRDFASESHEQVVFVSNHATLDIGDQSLLLTTRRAHRYRDQLTTLAIAAFNSSSSEYGVPSGNETMIGCWSAAAIANATTIATRKVTRKNFILAVRHWSGMLEEFVKSRYLQAKMEVASFSSDTLEIRGIRKGFWASHSDAPG